MREVGAASIERSVAVRWIEGYRTEVDVRGAHRLTSDEPAQVGGEDAGPMPTELLLASLATCLCLSVAHVARKRRMALADLTVHAEGAKNLEAFRFDAIALTVRAALPAAALEKLVAQAERYCFVSNTLRQGCALRVKALASAGDDERSQEGEGEP